MDKETAIIKGAEMAQGAAESNWLLAVLLATVTGALIALIVILFKIIIKRNDERHEESLEKHEENETRIEKTEEQIGLLNKIIVRFDADMIWRDRETKEMKAHIDTNTDDLKKLL